MSLKKLEVGATLVIILAVVMLVSVSMVHAGDNNWTFLGLLGARVRAISVDPDNPRFIIVGVQGGEGIYCTSDRGQTWNACSSGAPSYMTVYDIAIARENRRVIYAATNRGVLKSTDRGASWLVVLEGGGYGGLIYRSISVNPVDTDLALATDETSRIWRTTDGGANWETIPLSDYAFAVEFAPGAPHIAYAVGRGAFRSSDFGANWEPANGGFITLPNLESLSVDPYSSDIVYMASHDSLYRTADGGQSWTVVSGGLGSTDIRDIFIDPDNQQLIYVGSYDPPGVYRSLDSAGNSWELLDAGLGGQSVMGVALNTASPQQIYAGTLSNGIWEYTVVSGAEDYSVSINDGALFTNQTGVTLSLTAPSGTTEMIIGNDGGFGGANWEPFASQASWTITSHGDYVIPRVVYVKFRTNGQTSGLYQDDIILDVNAPTGSIEITNTVRSAVVIGQAYPVMIHTTLTETLTHTAYLPITMRNARPGFTLVGAVLSANDDVSGVEDMLIDYDPGFVDAEWTPYVTEQNVWVPETGSQTVYVKFRDRAGNISEVYSDTAAP